MSASTETSYGQILKSTTLVGGSQVINILIGIIRTKFMALLLGPAGIGLMGMYQAATGMVGTVTGLGIGSSGVRQIAEAAGSGNAERIAITIYTLRRVALVLGFLGMLATAALSIPLSRLTFGDEHHAWAIAALGITLFFGSVSGGQAALVQGMRRIADLASMGVLGALLGTVLCIPIVYFWREDGIVPTLIAVSAMTILPSWWYARKIPVKDISASWKDVLREARGLVQLGVVFMASGLMSAGVLYAIRVLVVRELGMESVGLYQAANTLSTMYIGVILNAMGMDFYPRLTAVAEDNVTVNRLVNEQTEIGLLVAVPGLLATLVFSPYVIRLFYSVQFLPAYEVLRWQILGIFLRVVAWPIGFVLLAKGKGKVFFWTELAWNVTHVGLMWPCLRVFGLRGTGIAFFILYVTYTLGIYAVVRSISGFCWSLLNLRTGAALMGAIAVAFMTPYFLPEVASLLVNIVIITLVGAWCMRSVFNRVGHAWFTDLFTKLRRRLGLSNP